MKPPTPASPKAPPPAGRHPQGVVVRRLAPLLLPLASFVALALPLALPASCGGSTSSLAAGDGAADGGPSEAGAGGGVSAQKAARDAASAYCARAEACAALYVTLAFGDVATCEARLLSPLLASLTAPGTSATAAQLETCAAALPRVTCEDLLGRATIPACQTLPGKLAAGAPCGTDAQCATTHCTVAPDALSCGTCAAQGVAGSGCGVDADCQPGMTCVGGMCASYGAAGAACSATQPCRASLGCVGGTCGAPRAPGGPCTTSAECDPLHGDFCNPQTLACQIIAVAQAGGACGLVSGQLTVCVGPSALCKGDNVPPYRGTCLAYAPDGASCDKDAGPLCGYGAVCAGGRCQVPDPSSCK